MRRSVARDNDQLSLGPLPLRNAERQDDAFLAPALTDDERITAEILDAAFTASGLTNKVAAADLGNKSVSLIEKWRSPSQHGSPSFAQLWELGRLHPQFGYEMNREVHRRCRRLGQQALANILANFGALAAAVVR